MTLELLAVTFRSPTPQRDAEFWAAVLGRLPRRDGRGILLPGTPRQVGLRFEPGAPHGPGKNRLHLHLTEGERDQWQTIAACRRSGGRLLGNGHVPENSYAVMADAAGDEFCVIEDGNAYLAGCGPLGEVTCEGTRAVGLFWSAALGWPLVWDEGDETVIQSPAGGTKIAWSGDPITHPADARRQTFELVAPHDDLAAEVDRLTALGAALAAPGTPDSPPDRDAATLVDPDGAPFIVRAATAVPALPAAPKLSKG